MDPHSWRVEKEAEVIICFFEWVSQNLRVISHSVKGQQDRSQNIPNIAERTTNSNDGKC